MMKPCFRKSALVARQEFQESLAIWFEKHGKDYPWRRTCDPYAILVAEVMLQQTQIATVLGRGFYQRFLETFPDLESLAGAGDERLLKAWEGLGYYRRARMLRATAQALLADHDGKFPVELDALMKLPGVGRYTAGALRAFAFGLPSAVVDGNVSRVLSRVMDFSAPVDDGKGHGQIWEWAEVLADSVRPRIYNSAIMELGQTLCRPGVPECLICPVAAFCKAGEPERLPVKRQKVAITAVDEHALWLRDASGRLLLHRENGKRRQGLWKLPTRPAAEISKLNVLAEDCYMITRYRVTLRVHDGSDLKKFCPAEDELWREAKDVMGLAMPSPFRRVIERISNDSGNGV